MAKAPTAAKTQVAVVEENGALVLPDFMREDAGLGMEGVDRTSMAIPRISLMHPTSVPVGNGEAKAGNFYHTSLREDLGDEIIVVPVYTETGYALWDPSGEANAPLARGRRNEKGIWVWDPSNTQFEVMVNGKKEIWDTKNSIAESRLTHWPKGNPPPPGKESLNFLFALPEVGTGTFGVMTFQKSAFSIGKKFMDNIRMRAQGGPSFALRYKIKSTTVTASNGKKHLAPDFSFVGINSDETAYRFCKTMHSQVAKSGLYGIAEEVDHGEGDNAVTEGDY